MSSSGILDALRNEERSLKSQLVAIQRAIEAIEGAAAPTARRGSRKAVKAVGRRKRTMTAEQRRAVAERMRKYWAARRAEGRGELTAAVTRTARFRSHPARGGGLRVGGSGSRDRPRLCGGLPDGRQGDGPGARSSVQRASDGVVRAGGCVFGATSAGRGPRVGTGRRAAVCSGRRPRPGRRRRLRPRCSRAARPRRFRRG